MADPQSRPNGGVERSLSAVLIFFTLVLFLVRLGDRAVVSEEFRWAEIAREMRATGDYLHPTINGQTYYDKPVGSYWLIVAASYVTGGVNETAARLPAAISGVIGVGLVVVLARKFYEARVALLAGAILATCFGYVFYSRRATADVETVVGVLAAIYLYAHNQDRKGYAWVILLWALMAATSLTKGLLGFALPLVVMGTDSVLRVFSARRESGLFRSLVEQSRWFFNWWTVMALPLGVALYLVPFLLSASETGAATGLEMVWRENLKRFVLPHNHTGPVYLYCGVIFVLAAPWSLFLPTALMPTSGRSPDARLIRVYFWAVFIFFTISASRRSYYLLPVLPPAAILIADFISRSRTELGRIPLRIRDVGWGIFGIGAVLCGLGLLSPSWVLPAPYNEFPPLPYRGVFAIGWLAGLGLLGTAASGRTMRLEWSAVIVVFALMIYVFGIAWPEADDQRTRRAFVAEVLAKTGGAPDKLALFHARDIVFDLGRTVPDYTDAIELTNAMNGGKVRWVLARRRYLTGIPFPAQIVSEEAVRPWEGDEQLGDKMVLLQAMPR